ncbi:MAG: MucR family transcriptional regulator [Janthinobacterium lividum]
MSDTTQATLVEMTSEVVAAYIGQNHVQPGDLPALIASVHAAFGGLGKPSEPEVSAEPLVPPISIKKSVTDGYLVSMEDGKQYKTLKRHISTRGLTPEQYRTKWGLPANYPMVAPAYAAKRSKLAKGFGLGRKTVIA